MPTTYNVRRCQNRRAANQRRGWKEQTRSAETAYERDTLPVAMRGIGAKLVRGHASMTKDESKLPHSKILVADDNVQNCELIDAYLSEEGYELSLAYDGQQTIKRVEELQPDLVLLDIMMPKLSGYEVCQWIKSNPRTKDIPVLMVTALNEQGDIEKAVRAGCDDFLTKPVNSLELKTRVKSLLRVRHLTNERDRLLAYMAEIEMSRSRVESR